MPEIWDLVAICTRIALYLGILGSSGLVIVRLVFRHETQSLHAVMVRQTAAFAILGLLAAFLTFALLGAELTGDRSGMTDPEILGLLWQTQVGTALICRVAGLVLAIAGLWLTGVGFPVAAVGVLLALWSVSMVGHVSALGVLWLELLLLLHLAGAAFWVGILLPLRALAGDPAKLALAASLGHRFGHIAAFVVPLLVAAGIVIAWQLLNGLDNLLSTQYGLTLLAKILAVSCLLAAAAANKFRFVPALRAGDTAAVGALRRSISIEWAFILLVLAATASLTNLQGPA